MSVQSFIRDPGNAYVLRTSNGGTTWHPQEISAGSIPYDGLVASSSLDAAALLQGDRHHHFSPLGELNRIAGQVHDNLTEPTGISDHLLRLARGVKRWR